MTRKDYIAIARIIRESDAYLPEYGRVNLIEEFCSMLLDDNPRFSASRFRSACNWIETTPEPDIARAVTGSTIPWSK